MKDITVTITGWVANDSRHTTDGDTERTTVRIASTPRYFDKTTQEWKDGKTEWFNAHALGTTAANIAASITKGQPVIVAGRLSTSTWDTDNGPRTDLWIDIDTIGHGRGEGRGVRSTERGTDPPRSVPAPPDPTTRLGS